MGVTVLVALRKESVDRNHCRRPRHSRYCRVALRKESVDRNMLKIGTLRNTHKSLSARRAWIEIKCLCLPEYTQTGRSPQGERG